MSQTIHWGYGIFWGGVYGLLHEEYPAIARAFGLPFAVGFTTFGEGLMLPSMGLSAPAHRYQASTLVRDVTAHWAYTATVDGTCRLLQAAEGLFAERSLKTNPELKRVS